MKKLMIFCVLFIIAFSLQAQDEMDVVTTEICDCINKTDYKSMDRASASQLIEGCITQSTISHIEFFMEGVDENNMGEEELATIMRKKGETVGIHASRNCPAFLEVIAIMTSTEDETAALEEEKETVITGEFVSFNSEDFFSGNLVEADGREHKLYWMEHFEGAMTLKNNPKKNIKKAVEVSYKEIESYNPKLQDYSSIKVITAIVWK